MKVKKAILLMAGRVSLYFFVNDNHTFNESGVSMWFEDDFGKAINIGDNYTYFKSLKENKKEIKETLKELYPQEKGLYREVKELLKIMKTYEEIF